MLLANFILFLVLHKYRLFKVFSGGKNALLFNTKVFNTTQIEIICKSSGKLRDLEETFPFRNFHESRGGGENFCSGSKRTKSFNKTRTIIVHRSEDVIYLV